MHACSLTHDPRPSSASANARLTLSAITYFQVQISKEISKVKSEVNVALAFLTPKQEVRSLFFTRA